MQKRLGGVTHLQIEDMKHAVGFRSDKVKDGKLRLAELLRDK